jgi:hypothetical protein
MALRIDPLDDAKTAEKKLKRQRLLDFLHSDEPASHDEPHPDIVALGTAGWVRALRNEKSGRQKDIEKRFSES